MSAQQEDEDVLEQDIFRSLWNEGGEAWNLDVLNDGAENWSEWNLDLTGDNTDQHGSPSLSTMNTHSHHQPARSRLSEGFDQNEPEDPAQGILQSRVTSTSLTRPHPRPGSQQHLQERAGSAGHNSLLMGSHSEDWLDRGAAVAGRSTRYLPEPAFAWDEDTPRARQSDTPETAIHIDDLVNDDEQPISSTRHSRTPTRHATVDLTRRSSSPSATTPRSLKRRATSPAPGSSSSSSKRARHATPPKPIATLDLTSSSPTLTHHEAHRPSSSSSSTSNTNTTTRLPRIGRRQCIICMEPYTNATTTTCGHIYCHECLTQALRAGEKANARHIGSCPVCRKPVRRPKPGQRSGYSKGSQVIPMAFMKRSAFREKGRSAQ